jgi:hypothetical protein
MKGEMFVMAKNFKLCPFCAGDVETYIPMLSGEPYTTIVYVRCKNCGAAWSFHKHESECETMRLYNRCAVTSESIHPVIASRQARQSIS